MHRFPLTAEPPLKGRIPASAIPAARQRARFGLGWVKSLLQLPSMGGLLLRFDPGSVAGMNVTSTAVI